MVKPLEDGKGLEIELVGEIAAMVSLGHGVMPGSASDRVLFACSMKVVAGTRNHLDLLLTG